MKIKRFLCCLVLFILTFSGINAKAVVNNANIVSEYSISDNSIDVKDEIEITKDIKRNNIKRSIKLVGNDEVEVKKIIIEDEDGSREVELFNSNNINKENFTVKKNYGSYDISINLVEAKEVKKVTIEYSFKKFTNYATQNGFAFLEMDLYSDINNSIHIDNQIVKLSKDVKGCWIDKQESSYSEEGNYHVIAIKQGSSTPGIIIAIDDKKDFLEQGKGSYNSIIRNMESSSFTKLYLDESITNKVVKSEIFQRIIVGLVLVICIVIFIVFKIKKIDISKIKAILDTKNNKNQNPIYNDYIYKEEELNFKLPKYIHPAFLGILFDTTEEDIIFTITLELIRKGAIEIVKEPDYTNSKNSGVYRKYIFKLSDEHIGLLPFEEEFINKLRDMDDIRLINLEDIQKLVGNGYFDSVVAKGEEDFNTYLRGKLSSEDLTLEEIVKGKNIEYDNWVKVKEEIKRLRLKNIEVLKVKEIELLHVFSTGLGIREKHFPLFKLVNPSVLRMSEYFTYLQKEFDNKETVLKYLERTFVK